MNISLHIIWLNLWKYFFFYLLLCALQTLAAVDLGDLDLDSFFTLITSEFYFGSSKLCLTTFTSGEVVNVEDWQSSSFSLVCVMVTSRFTEATRSLTSLWTKFKYSVKSRQITGNRGNSHHKLIHVWHNFIF